jgi:hypothetical protein
LTDTVGLGKSIRKIIKKIISEIDLNRGASKERMRKAVNLDLIWGISAPMKDGLFLIVSALVGYGSGSPVAWFSVRWIVSLGGGLGGV